MLNIESIENKVRLQELKECIYPDHKGVFVAYAIDAIDLAYAEAAEDCTDHIYVSAFAGVNIRNDVKYFKDGKEPGTPFRAYRILSTTVSASVGNNTVFEEEEYPVDEWRKRRRPDFLCNYKRIREAVELAGRIVSLELDELQLPTRNIVIPSFSGDQPRST